MALLMVTGCSQMFAGTNPSRDIQGSGVWGIVADEAGKPVASARVYAYEVYPLNKDVYDTSQGMPPDVFPLPAPEEESTIESFIRQELGKDELAVPDDSPQESDEDEFESGGGASDEDFHGPADYKSGATDSNGMYILALPPGNYMLVARKRSNDAIDAGPLTPDDWSSLVSIPLELPGDPVQPEGGKHQVNFTVRKLSQGDATGRPAPGNRSQTAISGRIEDNSGHPLAGYRVSANLKPKLGLKPDFISAPTGQDGLFSLPLPKGGVYYLGIQDQLYGRYLPCRIESPKADAQDSSIRVDNDSVVGDVKIVCLGTM